MQHEGKIRPPVPHTMGERGSVKGLTAPQTTVRITPLQRNANPQGPTLSPAGERVGERGG